MDKFPMHRAAEDGDLEKVQHLIREGMSADILDNYKYTPLHCAAKYGHLEVSEFLVSQKINLDVKSEDGSTAVMVAAGFGHKNIVDFLLRSGAGVEGCSVFGNWTLLHHACRLGWTDTVKYVLENSKTELCVETTLQMTPLLLAASEGHADIVQILLKAGADVRVQDIDCWTVLHYASKKGWLQMVQQIIELERSLPAILTKESYARSRPTILTGGSNLRSRPTILTEGSNLRSRLAIFSEGSYVRSCPTVLTDISYVNVKTNMLMTPLLLAASEGHKDVVEFLIEAGADVDCRDDAKSWTVLHYACKWNWLQMVRKILQMKPFVNARVSENGNTPLHIASGLHHTEIVKELLMAGADTSITNHCAENAIVGKDMHSAASMGDIERIEHLLKLGVPVDTRDKRGFTPLHHAAKNDQLAVGKFLIRKSCDLNLKNEDDEPPIFFAVDNRNVEFVNLLVLSGAEVNGLPKGTNLTILHTACDFNWKDTVAYILQNAKVNIEARATTGHTPLMHAAVHGYCDVARLLLQAGANVHAHDNEGRGVLHLACVNENAEMVEVLLSAGADVNHEDCDKETPLHYAVDLGFSLEVIRVLIQHGAVFTHYDDDKLSENDLLKELVLKDVGLCARLIRNNFNYRSLPAVYKNFEYANRLPPIDRLHIGNSADVGGEIVKCIESEIETKTFCNVTKMHPTILTLMCVEALISAQPSKKKRSATDTFKQPTKKKLCSN